LNNSITNYENEIALAKKEFVIATTSVLKFLKGNTCSTETIQVKLNTLHSIAVEYFDIFSRSINEYSTSEYKTNKNTDSSKLDDAVIICNTILMHWTSLESYKERYDVMIPLVSERSYATIQAYIDHHDRKKAKQLRSKFVDVGLPVHGFTKRRRYITVTEGAALFGREIPWIGVAVLCGAIALLIYKVLEFRPDWIIEACIVIVVTLVVLARNPKRRYYRAFWATMTFIGSLSAIPAFDFTANNTVLNGLGAMEENVYRFIIKESHWSTILILGVIAIVCAILDSREQSNNQ